MPKPVLAERPTPKRPGPSKARSVRVPDHEWEAAQEVAALEGLTVTDVIRHYLRAYVAGADAG